MGFGKDHDRMLFANVVLNRFQIFFGGAICGGKRQTTEHHNKIANTGNRNGVRVGDDKGPLRSCDANLADKSIHDVGVIAIDKIACFTEVFDGFAVDDFDIQRNLACQKEDRNGDEKIDEERKNSPQYVFMNIAKILIEGLSFDLCARKIVVEQVAIIDDALRIFSFALIISKSIDSICSME